MTVICYVEHDGQNNILNLHYSRDPREPQRASALVFASHLNWKCWDSNLWPSASSKEGFLIRERQLMSHITTAVNSIFTGLCN